MADKYYQEFENTVQRDELIAGTEHTRLENVSVKGGAEFSRGCILAGTDNLFEPAKAAADAKKVLVIAAEDYFSADSAVGVTSAYTAGNFTLEKLSTGSSVVGAADFKESLRQVGIFETSMHEIF